MAVYNGVDAFFQKLNLAIGCWTLLPRDEYKLYKFGPKSYELDCGIIRYGSKWVVLSKKINEIK